MKSKHYTNIIMDDIVGDTDLTMYPGKIIQVDNYNQIIQTPFEAVPPMSPGERAFRRITKQIENAESD